MTDPQPTPPAQLLAAARSAATHWASDVVDVELLAVSENAVYRVETATGERFVLRLHREGYNSLPEMLCEVEWVNQLLASGVPVSIPRPTLTGEWYLPIGVDERTRFAGAVEWVDGAPMGAALEANDGSLEAHYSRLGTAAALVRRHAETWELPDGFRRRHWDADGFVGPDPLWGRFWESTAATAPQQDLLVRARDHLRGLLGDLSKDRDRYGLIHADLHPNNVMLHGADMTLIDFDDAGFGWYIHELAVALHSERSEAWFEDARDALIRGYNSVHVLGTDEVELLDSFLLVRSLMLVGWLDARPELRKHANLPTFITSAIEHAEAVIG